MKLAIELSDQQAERLREEATRLGLEPDQRVLEKNRELYRRLG